MLESILEIITMWILYILLFIFVILFSTIFIIYLLGMYLESLSEYEREEFDNKINNFLEKFFK